MGEKKSFPLRIDEKIYGAMRHWSGDELRSINAQIEYVLRESLRRAGRWPPDEHAEPDSE